MDRLTKFAYLIHVKSTHTAKDYTRIYINEIVSLYELLLSIILDRDFQFTCCFCKAFQKGLCTQVKLSYAFHPQTYGQAECTIKTLEDMLRAFVIDFKGSCDDHLPLIEFSYNNRFHSSISMEHFETHYGRRCWSLI